MIRKKNLKIKRDKDLCRKLLRHMDFLHQFRAEAGSFLR